MSGKSKILLVEDDFSLGFVVQDSLKQLGYEVHLCKDGKEGLNYFNQNDYDLCILDVMLPHKDGFSLAQDIRKTSNVPIVFLTAKSMTEDKVAGFKAGADDYITKPFGREEFLLRIQAILKRSGVNSGEVEKPKVYEIGKYTYDYENYRLITANFEKILTKKEADVLKLLCEQRGKVLERELLTNMVWGDDNYFVGRSLDVFITKLRKYLSLDPTVKITNVHGVGFKLEVN
jgi:DNA-binding response OmpR family regulator